VAPCFPWPLIRGQGGQRTPLGQDFARPNRNQGESLLTANRGFRKRRKPTVELLTQKIESTLQAQSHCLVRPEELERVWPNLNMDEREDLVREFAHEHGWQVFSYGRALGAMFVPDQSAVGRIPS
jgi:hypothetical protein